MAARRVNEPKVPETPSRPGTTLEDRELELVSLAVDLAEKQLREGSASSQVTTHFLKLASTRERLEQMRLENEISLLQSKREEIESRKRLEDLYVEAMSAFTEYSGNAPVLDEDDYED